MDLEATRKALKAAIDSRSLSRCHNAHFLQP